MNISPFHTTVENDYGLHIVRFVEPPFWKIQEFAGSRDGDRGFSDPGEAVREFKKYARHERSGFLDRSAFEQRILDHQQDVQKLKAWCSGSAKGGVA